LISNVVSGQVWLCIWYCGLVVWILVIKTWNVFSWYWSCVCKNQRI